MTIATLIAALVAIASAFTWAAKQYRFGPFLDEAPEPLPGTPTSLATPSTPPNLTPALEPLYTASYACIGKEMSPKDLAPDEYACVESLEGVYHLCKGTFIGGSKQLLSTLELITMLRVHPDFKEVGTPTPGCVIVSATGTGNGKIRGHCGVVGKTNIMNNNSRTGLWEANYTVEQWKDRFERYGGMKTRFFRCV